MAASRVCKPPAQPLERGAGGPAVPAPEPLAVPPALPVVPDTGTSVAGEEDPGAALDLASMNRL